MADEQLLKPNPANQAELMAAYSGPSVLANKIVVTAEGHAFRIAFLEVSPGGETISLRAAVTLKPEDVIATYHLLKGLAAPYEAIISAQEGANV